MMDKHEWMRESGFSDRMRQARKKASLTQEEAACELGMQAKLICMIEHAETTPSIVRVCQMAELYGVSLDWLCGRDETHGLD